MRNMTPMVVIAAIIAAAGIARGSDVSKQFFVDIEKGDAKHIIAGMTPEIAAQVDVPVMQLLAATIRERLGSVEKITTTGLSFKLTADGRLSERSVDVVLEKGKAKCRFATLNGKLVMFDVQSDQLVGWLKVPTDTKPYERLATQGLKEILTGDPTKARNMWHDALKNVVSAEKLREIKQIIDTNLGQIHAIEVQSVVPDKGETPGLRINFAIEAENADTTGHILIQFAGMKGHILGFNVSLPSSD